MEVKILGAHNIETRDTRLPCVLVDNIIAMDAGGLASSLTLTEQERIRAILLSHRHYDHVRDIPILCLATFDTYTPLHVYGLEDTLGALHSYLLDGTIYPDFTMRPSKAHPKLLLTPVESQEEFALFGYRVRPMAVPHKTPAVGYHLTSPSGSAIFYSGDTSGPLTETWQSLSMNLIIIEVTYPDQMLEAARENGHLTPLMLRNELLSLRTSQGFIPPIVVVHMHPSFENDIRAQLQIVSTDLGISITPAFEGLLLRV